MNRFLITIRNKCFSIVEAYRECINNEPFASESYEQNLDQSKKLSYGETGVSTVFPTVCTMFPRCFNCVPIVRTQLKHRGNTLEIRKKLSYGEKKDVF